MTSENVKGGPVLEPLSFDFFISHQAYPWQVALQQSPLPFSLTKQK